MRIVVLGASGIVGQHMRLCIPEGVEAVFCRRRASFEHAQFDLVEEPPSALEQRVGQLDAVVNLAGENRVDLVEISPREHEAVNVLAPTALAAWCKSKGVRLVHVSTQGIFSGENPPYGPGAKPSPVNAYGRQKAVAEEAVLRCGAAVARLTFIVGVRPMQHVGRVNPLEQMLDATKQRQVDDRFFSVAFARDAAKQLWRIAAGGAERIVHVGHPRGVSRYLIATEANDLAGRGGRGVHIEPVPHSSFDGIAARPHNTCWDETAVWEGSFHDRLRECVEDWQSLHLLGAGQRARELALFLGVSEESARARLNFGFNAAHVEVARDFRRASPLTDEELLSWYRSTETYLWELSAYHADERFNYAGMCSGFAEHLSTRGVDDVLCLGDGIGDLTLALARHGLGACYHDLEGSRTAEFAKFRFLLYGQAPSCVLTPSWAPPDVPGERFGAVVALDFFEHLPNVEDWARAVMRMLRPGGIFFAQNAFGIGDDEHEGSIPMHLVRNNRYVTGWDPLCELLGLVRESTGWWRKRS